MDRRGAEAGHLIVFDPAPDRTWEDKLFHHPRRPAAHRSPSGACEGHVGRPFSASLTPASLASIGNPNM